MSLSAIPSPERRDLALQVLKALVFFGAYATTTDYLSGRHLTAAEDACIVLSAALALYLARSARYAALPLITSVALLTFMCLLGTLTLLPHHLENTVWASIFPFAFFYLTGVRIGMLLSVFCAVSIPLSYFIAPWFSSAPRITPYSLSQIIGAFLLSTVLAYKYEQIRSKQECLLRHSAECDPLTGLLNRRGFSALSQAVVRRTVDAQQTFAVVLIDIDDFKLVNDRQGHDAGDRLLRELAALLRQHTRSSDLAARWGGEEFILLLAHINLAGAQTVTEKIRAAIAGHQFASGNHTASLGIALHTPDESLEKTIDRADQAMYQAKRNGKNKVEVLALQPA